ncbi:Tll0287-like domain-containing protein [Hydrogenimonas sp.]
MKMVQAMVMSMVAAAVLAASQSGHEGHKHSDELKEVVKTGKEASKLLLKTLGGNMKKHMKAGGPAEALEFCSANAAALTADVDAKLGKGVAIKRITLKPRNPANEAQGSERAILEALQTLKANGVQLPRHLVQKTPEGYRYYKPLLISKPVCLKCHGEKIAPGFKKKILSIYPDDNATGYRMGDLRGAIVVDIKK